MAHPTQQYAYDPPPQEMAFYDYLFAQADTSNSGYISGPSAVEFLSLSKLPVELLKTIWGMADNPPTNMLDKKKFIVAVRLIQLFQNGKRPSDSELHIGQGEVVRPPFFEGMQISNQQMLQPMLQDQSHQQHSSPPMHPQQVPQIPHQQLSPLRATIHPQVQQHQFPVGPTFSTALAVQDPYSMTPQEYSRYETLFPSYAQPDGFLYGQQAVELFSKSGMDRGHLKDVWAMSDNPIDNKLDKVEFAIAMHLIVCVTKKGLSMPPVLPPSLALFVREARTQEESSQHVMAPQQSMGGGISIASGLVPSPEKMPQMVMNYDRGLVQPNPQMDQGTMPNVRQFDHGGFGLEQPHTEKPQIIEGGMSKQLHETYDNSIGKTVDDAFAGLSNEPVSNVEDFGATRGGMSIAGASSGVSVKDFGSMNLGTKLHQVSEPAATLHSISHNPTFTVAHYEPVSPKQKKQSNSSPVLHAQPIRHHEHIETSPRQSTKRYQEENEDFNSELERLRTAYQKLQAEVISLRAKAKLFSDEEYHARSEIRSLESSILVLHSELSELKDEVTDSKAKLSDSLATLKYQKEQFQLLNATVKDTRDIKDFLVSANDIVVEANDNMIKEHAQAIAAKSKATEESALVSNSQTEDLFSWDVVTGQAPIAHSTPEVMQPMGSTRGIEDSSVRSVPLPTLNLTLNTAHVTDFDDEVSKFGDVHSVYSSNTLQNVNAGQQGNYFGEHSSFSFMGGVPTSSEEVEETRGSSFSGGFMGMGTLNPTGSFIPEVNSKVYDTPTTTPLKINSPSVATVEAMKRDALQAEKSFRQSDELVDTLKREIEKLESAAQKADEDLKILEKKKGSFVGGKGKKKKEIAAAQEHAFSERQKVEEAQKQLNTAQKVADAAKKEAEELRQQSEQAEMEAATAASYMSVYMTSNSVQQQASSTSDGYDHFGEGYSQNGNSYNMEIMGSKSHNQGDYSNPFSMG